MKWTTNIENILRKRRVADCLYTGFSYCRTKVKAYGWILLVSFMLTATLSPAIAEQEDAASSKAQQQADSLWADIAHNRQVNDIEKAAVQPLSKIEAISPGSQVTRLSGPAEEKELSSFFKIGIAINLIMLAVYFIWAARQWRRTRK